MLQALYLFIYDSSSDNDARWRTIADNNGIRWLPTICYGIKIKRGSYSIIKKVKSNTRTSTLIRETI